MTQHLINILAREKTLSLLLNAIYSDAQRHMQTDSNPISPHQHISLGLQPVLGFRLPLLVGVVIAFQSIWCGLNTLYEMASSDQCVNRHGFIKASQDASFHEEHVFLPFSSTPFIFIK